MAKAYDPKTREVIEVGSSFETGLNPELIAGKTLVPDTTPLGVISASSLNPVTPINVPPPPTSLPIDLTGGQATIDSLNKLLAQDIAPASAPASLEAMFNKLLPTSGVPEAQADVLTKQTSSKAARDRLAAINAQLAGISAETQATPLRLQEEATGRGVTKAGLAPLEAGELRKIALRALPLQAQALAAQAEVAAAQGDVELSQQTLAMAQDKLKTIFGLVSQDVENKYNYFKDLRDKAFQIADKNQQQKLAAAQKEDDRKFTNWQNIINDAQTKASALMSTDPALAAKISARVGQSTGINDTNLGVDVAKLMEGVKAKPISETPALYVPGSNPTVDNWARLIISGQAKITDVPNPKGSTMRSDVTNAIATSGQLLLSDKDREKLSTLDTAFNVYETIKGLSEKINTFGVGGRITGALSRYVGGKTQFNTDIARYDAARQGFVSNVARTLGEKGTLAEGDVQRAINNLPTVNDTKAVAEGKLETLRTILQGAKDSIIQKSTEPLTGTTSGTIQTFVSGITQTSTPATPEALRAKYNY